MPIWITSKSSTAIGVDDFFHDFHYEEFLECVEALVVNRRPQISIPSQDHLKKLPSLCVMPQTDQFLRRSHYMTSDTTVAGRSLRILQGLVTWIVENWSENAQALEVYDIIRLGFLPVTKSKRKRHSGAARSTFDKLVQEVEANEREYAEQAEPSQEDGGDAENQNEKGELGTDFSEVPTPFLDLESKKPARLEDISYYDIPVPTLFDDAKQIWNFIGWMLQCSTINSLEYKYRWKQFKPFLEMLLDLLEIDQQIAFQRRENNTETSRKQNDGLMEIWINSGVHHSDILRAILATVNEDGTLDFNPVLDGEPNSFPVESRSSVDSSMLRSRLLDLVMNSLDGDRSRLNEFIEDSGLYFIKEYTHFMLVPRSLYIACTLGRLAWSVCLDERVRPEYILRAMNFKGITSALSAKPGRLVFSQPPDSLLFLLKVHADLITQLYVDESINLSDAQKTDLLEAYDRGHELRKEWFTKRLHTSRARPPPELNQLESSLHAMIECLE